MGLMRRVWGNRSYGTYHGSGLQSDAEVGDAAEVPMQESLSFSQVE